MSGTVLLVWWPSQQQTDLQMDAGQNLRIRYEIRPLPGERSTRRLQGGTALLRDLPRNLDCIVLLDPRHVLLLEAQLPRLNARQLREGLAYLVESQMISAPEDNWVAAQETLGPPVDGQTPTLVSAIDRTTVRHLLPQLADSGLRVRHISVEPLVLTAPGRAVWLNCQADGAWIGAQHTVPWFVPMDDASATARLLTWWQQRRPDNDAEWLVVGADEAQHRLLSPHLQTVAWSDRSALVMRPKLGALVPAGEIRRAGAAGKRSGSAWRIPLRLSAILLLGWVIGFNAYAWQQQRELAAIEARIEKAFTQSLPNTPLIADPVLLMQRRKTELLQGQQTLGTPEFSRLLHQAGLALADLPFNVVETIDYQTGHLLLVLNTAPSNEQRSVIETSLRAQQLNPQWGLDTNKRTTLKIATGSGA
jgi:type II secretion system protein L